MSYLEFEAPAETDAKIKVIGIGGAGCNAVNRMIDADIQGVDFVAVNTDKQALNKSKAEMKLQIGDKLTKGLGAGGSPDVGQKSAEESIDDIVNYVQGSDLVFITAGMGGGTGTGAAPIIARAAKTSGALTIGVVTRPFSFEGKKRSENAELGIKLLKNYVDSLVIVPNDKLLDISTQSTTLLDAFVNADEVLKDGVAGISSVISDSGLINLDFADVKTVMGNRGIAHMGVGVGKGENRIEDAVSGAINSPLLETSISGAKGVLFNIEGGFDLTMLEVNKASEIIHSQVADDAVIIFGTSIKEDLQGTIKITVIATGFEDNQSRPQPVEAPVNDFVAPAVPKDDWKMTPSVTGDFSLSDELKNINSQAQYDTYKGLSENTFSDTFSSTYSDLNIGSHSGSTYRHMSDATTLDMSSTASDYQVLEGLYRKKGDKDKTDDKFPILADLSNFK